MWQVGPRSGQGTQGRAGSLSPSDMVEQNRSGIYTQIVYSPAGGKLALMNGQTLSKAFVPLPGGGTAVYNSAGLQYYRHADWLGSSRFASTPTTRAMYSDTAYAPFGETYAAAGTADPSFTGQNQDTVGNLYDFMYREYATQGRWPSPDPAGRAAVSLSNPQSWNRYAYVFNNPLAIVDPLGLCGQHAIDAAGYDVCGPEGVINRDPYSVASFSSCVQVACIFGGVGNIPGCLESGFGCPGDGVGRGLCGPEDSSCASGGVGAGGCVGPVCFSGSASGSGFPIRLLGNNTCINSPLEPVPTFQTSSGPACGLLGQLNPNLAGLLTFDAQQQTQPQAPSRFSLASRAAIHTFWVSQGVGTAYGCVDGALVAAGLTVATDTYPLVGYTVPGGCAVGGIIGFFETIPVSYGVAAVDFAWTYWRH